jgi:DNA repair protein RecO (recombination protein O)
VEQQPIDPLAQYSYDPDHGPYRVVSGQYSGQSLMALACDDLSSPIACAEVKSLLQSMIKKLLGGKPIYSRLLFL